MNNICNTCEVVYDDIDYSEGTGGFSSIETTPGSAGEALLNCLNEFGVVDLEWMSWESELPVEQLIRELRGKAIFQDPEAFASSSRWSPLLHWYAAPVYLQGNIPQKYSMALKMNERFKHCFDANVKALRAMLPAKVTSDYIHPALGATWLPARFYAAFIKQLLKFRTAPEVSFSSELAEWKVKAPDGVSGSIENRFTYGTFYITAVKIIEKTMNAQTVKVYDYNYTSLGRCEVTLNDKKTFEAQEKQRQIIAAFEDWVHSDPAREDKITEYYNDAFVGYTTSAYDGSFLELPDLSPNVKLYPHQLNAIARILLSKSNILLAHDVGTGKTYEMIVSAHEMHRMDLSRKNIVVVPNNVLEATVSAHRSLYPKDSILAVFPKDFVPKKRCETIGRIRDGDYVCIYMAYSSFDMIPMSKSYWIAKKQADISALEREAIAASTGSAKLALSTEIEAKKKELSKYAVEGKDPAWPCFDSLGINTLYLDEAHNYKNIPIPTKSDGVVGLRKAGCKKCRDMLEKVHFVDRAVFATGTPLTNSLSDLFVLQLYLQPEILKLRKINSFDAWVQTFSRKESNYEVDVTSSSITPVERFSSFHNLTELMSIFSMVCDFHHSTGENLPSYSGPVNVSIPRNRMQNEYVRCLVKRAEDVHTHAVNRKEDNLLKITTDGRKCALDVRLVDLDKYEIPVDLRMAGGKVEACAAKVYGLYRAYPGTCQIVFSDIGTPRLGYNVYDALKLELMRRGIPECEIAYVHDAESESARSKLFASINEAKTRVIIGSTPKLGIGVNIQEKLIALHHLSVPWRPSDMVQREGRLLRQGNSCPEVFVFRYITEGTFDSYSWQLLENKQRFISSFLSGVSCERESEDISDAVLSYAEVKALAIGDPLIKKRVETSNRIERTRIASTQRQRTLMQLRSIIEEIPETIEKLKQLKATAKADNDYYRSRRGRVNKHERESFGDALLAAVRGNGMCETERFFDSYQGFDVILPMNMTFDDPFVIVRSRNGGSYRVEMDGDKALGCAKRIDNLLDGLPAYMAELDRQILEQRRKRRAAEAELDLGNPYKEEIESLLDQLNKIDEKIAAKKENKK